MEKKRLTYLERALGIECILLFVIGKMLCFSTVTQSMLLYSACGFLAVLGMDVSIRANSRIEEKAPLKTGRYLTVSRLFSIWSVLMTAAGLLGVHLWPDRQYLRSGTEIFVWLIVTVLICETVRDIQQLKLDRQRDKERNG